MSIRGASNSAIQALEQKLGIALPTEYKQFLLITNGLDLPSYTEPNFVAADKVTFLRDNQTEIIEAYSFDEAYSIGNDLRNSILVTETDAEQYFLLIPPTQQSNWKFWKFANWLPGEAEYSSLTAYFQEVIEIIKEERA